METAMKRIVCATLTAVALAITPTVCDASKTGLEPGKVELKSSGPLAFGPDGILLVADTKAATIYAIDTAEDKADPAKVSHNVKGLAKKVAGMLGTTPEAIQISDLAVNPQTGTVYFSVGRGRGSDATPVLLRMTSKGMEHFKTDKVDCAKATLPNAPEDKVTGRGRRQMNKRLFSVTDMAYIDGNIIVAGLSNEEFASNLRTFEFPFNKVTNGSAVEIYHGAHGKYETNSPIRTFVPFMVAGEPHVLAAYTCTPLVKFPVKELKKEKLRGTTVAELGNWNRPRDMISYKKDGKSFLLLSNSSDKRGVMKISTADLDKAESITERVSGGGIAGQKFEKVESMPMIAQMDKLNETHAVVLTDKDELKTVALP